MYYFAIYVQNVFFSFQLVQETTLKSLFGCPTLAPMFDPKGSKFEAQNDMCVLTDICS